MGKNSAISWTTHTFNHVRGCTRVSPGCTNCYAAAASKRNPGTLGVWGDRGTRVVAAEAMWNEPIKWNKLHAEQQQEVWQNHGPTMDRPRVFNASFADWAEEWQGPMVNHKGAQLFNDRSNGNFWNQTEKIVKGMGEGAVSMADVRQRLFDVIDKTPYLDWLMLTKRPENIKRMTELIRLDGGTTGRLAELDIETPAHRYFRRNMWLGTTVENQKYADLRVSQLMTCRICLQCVP